LAIVVNLLLVVLVLAVGIAVGRATTPGQEVASIAPAPVSSTVVSQLSFQTRVPEACLDTAELGDEIIARLNRNERDARLFLALRDYTIASQSCRRAATP
jgi:hypothetical protein